MDKPTQKQTNEPTTLSAVDIEAFAHNLARVVEEGGKALAAYMKPREEGTIKSEMAEDVADVVKTIGHVTEYWLSDPQRAVELQASLGRAYLDLWASAVKRMAGEETKPVAAPDPKDKRFADPEWSQNQFFDFLKQAYLLTTQWANHLVKDADGVDAHTRQKAEFYIKQIANAISPSNFVLTNPELLRETLSSNADNLVRGMHMLTEDIQAGHGNLRIRQSDSSVFEVGRNLALTPGKVVFQNDLIQLIQYEATTKDVLKVPLLIVPPWINKFYILDLTPEKSFIKWCVDQGISVFVVSWVNPDARARREKLRGIHGGRRHRRARRRRGSDRRKPGQRHRLLRRRHAARDYARLSRRQKTSQAERPRALGHVVRRASRFHLRRRPDGVRRQGAHRATRRAHEGAGLSRSLAHGQRLQHAALERSDLALRGQQLPARARSPSRSTFSTGIPTPPACRRQTILFYLRNCYLDNNLTKGKMEIGGVTLDLHKVTVPIYNLATREDHIAPAKSVLLGSKYFGGEVKYVLAGSGHIAGVVNPPATKKYQYWTGGKPGGADLDAWLAKAKEHPGSWWPDWLDWLKARDDDIVPARKIGGGKLKPIEDAPGTYVKMRD